MRRQHHSPHIGDFSGPLRDYNGTGRWSVVSVQQRYLDYCRTFDVTAPELPCPKEQQEGDHHWIYPVMDSVIAGIRRGDKACVALGVEFIEEPEYFAFGRILKANTARALRGATLSSEQVVRLRARIVNMLLVGDVPHEYHEYSRLLRRIGLGEWWPTVEQQIARENRYVMRYYEYLRKNAVPPNGDSTKSG
jgi:hypothetical protein